MHIAGVVAEFDPLHLGHQHLLTEVRARLGASCGIVAVMSGSFTQRGEAAICTPTARAEMALRAGCNLVLELPLTFSLASAERFAYGGISLLQAAGLVDTLCFGSECANADLLHELADTLNSPDFGEILRSFLSAGVSFAYARQQALETLLGKKVPAGANDLLATEYLRFWHGETIAVARSDAGHNGAQSASEVRRKLLSGDQNAAFALLPEFSADILIRESASGCAPASLLQLDRAMLCRMRAMTPEEFAAIPDCTEGLENRLTAAAAQARTMEEFYTLAKSKRYAHARLRRIALRAFLGITELPDHPAYLRVLGADACGLEMLRRMKQTASLPVITKTAHGHNLAAPAQRQFLTDRAADDLWGLCLAEVQPKGCAWRTGPVIFK